MKKILTLGSVLGLVLGLSACSSNKDSSQDTSIDTFSVLFGGTQVGEMKIEQTGNQVDVDFSFSNNGRGASSEETILLTDAGVPKDWTIKGKTVFGNAVDESYQQQQGVGQWRSAAGEGEAQLTGSPVYVAQNASPYGLYIYALKALNSDDKTYPALPSGEISISPKKQIELSNNGDSVDATVYALGGIDMDPQYIILNDQQDFIGFATPRFSLIKKGFEQEDERVRNLVATLNAQRFEKIAEQVTHKYERPVRVNNVRIFQPQELSLSEPVSVLVKDNKIAAIEPVKQQKSESEVVIDGEGGTLIPGLYEMHGHMGDNQALLNVLAGVTSVRDMGNEMDVLEALEKKIKSGQLVGPRITKSGFIEGVSDFSNATGELAPTKEDALQLVRDYAAKDGYWQIKIYSSMNGEWIPEIAEEAKKHNLRVAGHVPAFYKADQMIEAGYDEITHINQLMLGWVLGPKEDTRTLFRVTGMKRFNDLDLDSEAVKHTLDLMVENDIALDPTTVIHEHGMTSRNGQTRIGAKDYIEHMPISVQRRAKVAMLNVADEEEDQAYKSAFDKIIATLKLMHEKGILLVPGTDMGGAFELHRELELFQQFGMTPAEVLKRGSYDMAKYLGEEDQLGSIEEGKLADFFLVPGNPIEDIKAIKTISMVTTNGKFFFPTEVYPEFGIKPFTDKPEIAL